MKVEEISHENSILAKIVRDAGWEEGLHFASSETEFEQVGIWGYNRGWKSKPHSHTVKHRSVTRTQEVLFVIEGAVRADIYTEDAQLLKSVDLRKGDILILLNGGHGYEILENKTRVLEVKNGPYLGVDQDRKIIRLNGVH
jgi:hypothetical protein